MTLRVDNSILQSVAACSTQAILKYHHHLVSQDERIELLAGKAIHAAVAVHLGGGTLQAARAAFLAAYPRPTVEQLVPADNRYAHDNVYRIIDHWLVSNPVQKLPFATLGEAYIEVGASVALDERGEYVLVGKLDALGRDNDVGMNHVIDVKSTGRIAGQWEKKWRIASQITGYHWLAEQAWDVQVVGAFIIAIEVAKLPMSDRRCKEHGVPYSECSVLHAQSAILPVQRTPEQIATWKRNALGLMKRWERLRERYPTLEYLEAVPMEGSFHNECQWCPFMDFCTMGRPVERIPQMFAVQRWEPFPGAFDGDA